jgi:copper chaperone
MMTVHFTVKGMSCSGCSQSIMRKLTNTAGVQHATADHVAGTADVTFDEQLVSPTALCEVIENLGFDSTMHSVPAEG